MNKLNILVISFVMLFFSSMVYAARNEETAQGSGQGNQGSTGNQQQQRMVSPSPTGNQVQNQNQEKTQNQGEESQIKNGTQEQENLQENNDLNGNGEPKEISPRNETATQNMSDVAKKVEELLTTKTIQGGIGEQVRLIAQEQKNVQAQIQDELGKVNNRNKLLTSIFGPEYKSLNNMQKQIEQNQMHIQQLTQAQNQLSNTDEITQVQEMIQALTDQNVYLNDRIALEEQSKSLFGWLFKLLNK